MTEQEEEETQRLALRRMREKKFAGDRARAAKKDLVVARRLIPYAGAEKRGHHYHHKDEGPPSPRGKRKIGRPKKDPTRPPIKHRKRTELPEDFK